MIKPNEEFTDESGLYAKYIGFPKIVEGSPLNKKLTRPEDFTISENVFVGTGFDLHVLVENRKLILGGIEIPHTKGLLGHSDADVLTHAVMDALLGAAALGDIGKHFPDSDPEYKNIDSRILLSRTALLIREKGWQIGNIDATVVAQAPRLSSYIPKMRETVASTLDIELDAISIKATTEEHLGFTGEGEGIAAHAVCLIEKIK